jgi:hypothetical protein
VLVVQLEFDDEGNLAKLGTTAKISPLVTIDLLAQAIHQVVLSVSQAEKKRPDIVIPKMVVPGIQ